MRRFVLAAVIAAVCVVPAAALGEQAGPGPGSLVVQDGRGFVAVAAKGGIIGRFDDGKISIDWGDGKQPIITGVERVRPLGVHKILYIGQNVHFYVGGAYRVRVDATGINLSAVGKGVATLASAEPGSPPPFSDPGFYRVDDGPLLPLPDSPIRIALGTG
jgi:hypothetical protein